MSITAEAQSGAGPYGFKPEPFSSHSLLLESFPLKGEGRRVLDIGGGEGYLSGALAERGYRVFCVAAPGSVSANFPESVEVIEADLDVELPHLGEPFSYVLCGDVLEHLRRPDQTLRWLRENLAAGGRLIASLPNGAHAYVRATILLGRFPKHDRGLFDRTHLHFFSWSGWVELLAGAGFSIESVRPTAVPVGLLAPRWRHSAFVRMMERVSYLAARVRKTLFAYQFVVVARPV